MTPYIIYEYGKGLGRTRYVEESEALQDSKETTMFYFNKQGVKCGTPDLTTGIKNQIIPDFLIVYPNPFSNYLSIEMDSENPYAYSLYNVTGNKILSGKLTGKMNIIDLSEFFTGVYILQIEVGNRLLHQKIIKK
jgi:hypothetical protein